jgi:hypothetical protein
MTSAPAGQPGSLRAPILPGDRWPLITPAGLRPGTGRRVVCSRCRRLVVTDGCFVLIYSIATVASSHVFTANARAVFGSLNS